MSDSLSRLPARPSLGQLRKQAKELLRAIRAGDGSAQERFRTILPRPANDITLADAQYVLARELGFQSWASLVHHIETLPRLDLDHHGLSARPPFYRIDVTRNLIELRQPMTARDWDQILDVMKEMRLTALDANGQVTDDVMARLADLDFVTTLGLAGSKQLTDAGLHHLAGMPQLQELDLSDHPGGVLSDRGLEALQHLTDLRRFQMCWQRGISDVGIRNLVGCHHLRRVDLLGTPTGDGAIQALAGKPNLHAFKTGRLVSDAGLLLLHQFPVFKTWRGGERSYALMSPDAEPTHLLLDGPFTDQGLAGIVGLDGLFGVTFFWHTPALTASGLKPLRDLSNLGFLGCQNALCNDEAMDHIAALPCLRMLMGQGSVAGDDGFRALSRSRTLEYFWGRQCPNLGSRGFAALAALPALRGLAVSCKNVDDTALAALPQFPALGEFMPMDVPDAGFCHIGRCTQLEALWCMYCPDTGDSATEHIAGLSRLRTYYAGKTQITDRSLEILGRMPSLESIEFYGCSGITNAGLGYLVGHPRLREMKITACPRITREGAAVFPSLVHMNYRV